MTAPESRTSERILRGREREEQSLTLRLAGATYRQIGNQLGITEQGAHAAVMRALKRQIKRMAEPAEEVRQLELERLDRLLVGVWRQATQGNQGAIDRALKIMQRRAALLGLDEVTKQRVEVSVHDVEEARREILTALCRVRDDPEGARGVDKEPSE